MSSSVPLIKAKRRLDKFPLKFSLISLADEVENILLYSSFISTVSI